MCSIQLESLLNLVEMSRESGSLLVVPTNEVEEGFRPEWQTISHCQSRGFKVFLLFFSRETLFDATVSLLTFYLDL